MNRPVLLCYDGSDDARAAVRAAGAMLGGGRALVASVWTPTHADYIGTHLPSLGPAVRAAVEEMDGYAAKATAERAEDGCRLAEDAGFVAEPLVLRADGAVWSALVKAAVDQDAGVIVVGRRGLSPVSAALLGSVSNGVLNHANRPVVVVPAEED
jgi:nucleotide-binding universal stress UspA family protein